MFFSKSDEAFVSRQKAEVAGVHFSRWPWKEIEAGNL